MFFKQDPRFWQKPLGFGYNQAHGLCVCVGGGFTSDQSSGPGSPRKAGADTGTGNETHLTADLRCVSIAETRRL